MRLDHSTAFGVIFNKRSVNGPQVRGVFVSGKVKSHFKDESVELSVEFYSKE